MIERLIELALEQRALTLLLMIVLIAVGIYSIYNIPTDSFPDVSNVQVQIITEPESMASEEVESLVTIPIEYSLNGLPKVNKIRSNSSFGLSVVTAIFDDDMDVYLARQLVQQRLTTLKFPPEVPQPQLGPVVSSFSLVYTYYLKSDRHNLIDLRTIQDWQIAKRLLSVPGVGNVVTYGGWVKQYQVLVHPEKLKGYSLSIRDVLEAVSANNQNAGGNFIERGDEEVIIRGLGRITCTDDIGSIVLKEVNGTPVKLSQVASVEIGPAFRRGAASMDGKGEVVTGLVLTRKGANTKTVVEKVEQRLKEIAANLPDGVTVVPSYNQKELVNKTTDTVREILIFSGVLVIVILAAILMNVSAALIAAVIIPLAMLFSFIMMKFTGLSSNLMTLGAVDFGVIVDAGVVMVENVYRKLSQLHAEPNGNKQLDTLSVVRSAAKEVGRPITSAILIIMAVYIPLFTLEGVEGKMFHPLALTFIYAIIGALVVALTIIPVLCYWFMRKNVVEHHNPFVAAVRNRYQLLLAWSIAHPRPVLISSITLLLATACLLPLLGSEFIPSLDEGPILLRTKLPASVSLSESRRIANSIERIITKFPEVTHVVSRIGRSGMGSDLEGVENADVYIALKDKSQWSDRNKEHLVDRMAAEVSKVPGLMYSFSQPIADMIDDLVSGIKADVGIKIFGEDLEVIDRLTSQIEGVVRQVPGAADVSREFQLGLPQLNIRLRRQEIARYGLNVSHVQSLVQTALAGSVVTEVIEGSKRFGVLVRFPLERRDTEEDIRDMMITTPNGVRIPLKQLAEITSTSGVVMVNREDGQRRGAVLVNIRGRDLGSWVADAQRDVSKKVILPKGYWIVWGGQFENQQRAMTRLCIVVPIVLFLIFLLLYLTFNSLIHAALIMLTVPFATVGGIIGLWISHQTLSVPAIIGFIALFGVAVQNAVILVSYIMQLEQRGLGTEAAIKQGALVRLRPVLMTALVAMVGLIPKLFSDGTGAEIQRPLATVVFGGLLSATSLTLLVLPAVLNMIAKRRMKLSSLSKPTVEGDDTTKEEGTLEDVQRV